MPECGSTTLEYSRTKGGVMRLISFAWLVLLIGFVYFSVTVFMEIGNVDKVAYEVAKR